MADLSSAGLVAFWKISIKGSVKLSANLATLWSIRITAELQMD